MLEHGMDFGQVQFMDFHNKKENNGIFVGFGLIFEPNQTVVKRTLENPCPIFIQGYYETETESVKIKSC